MIWPRLGAIGAAVLVSLLFHNMFGWTQGWSFLFGLSTLLISFPVSIGIERGLDDKREMKEMLAKLREGGNGG
jgi:hypothetical protein